MQINNKDDIPVRVSAGEQIASNAALKLIGRDLIPAANKRALQMQNMKHGTHKRAGIQYPGNKLPPAPVDSGMDGYQYGTGIPGVQRVGNSYSRSGYLPQPDFSGVSNTPFGHQLPSGVQRVGNSYSRSNAPAGDTYPMALNATPENIGYQPYGHPLPGGVRRVGNSYSYADGTQEEEGVQMPGMMDRIKGMMNADTREENSEPRQSVKEETAEASAINEMDMQRQNYELQKTGKLPGYASGVMGKEGVQDEKIAPRLVTTSPLPYMQVARPQGNTPMYGQTLPRLQAGNAPKTSVDDGSGGTGTIQFQDGRVLDANQKLSLQNILATNAKNRDKYQANADAYAAQEAQKADQAKADRVLNMALTSPDANTQDIGSFLQTKSNQRAARDVLSPVLTAQQGKAELSQKTKENAANAEVAQKKAQLDYELENKKLNAPEYGVHDIYGEVNPLTGIAPKTGQTLYNKKTGTPATNDVFMSQLKQLQDAHAQNPAFDLNAALNELKKAHGL